MCVDSKTSQMGSGGGRGVREREREMDGFLFLFQRFLVRFQSSMNFSEPL